MTPVLGRQSQVISGAHWSDSLDSLLSSRPVRDHIPKVASFLDDSHSCLGHAHAHTCTYTYTRTQNKFSFKVFCFCCLSAILSFPPSQVLKSQRGHRRPDSPHQRLTTWKCFCLERVGCEAIYVSVILMVQGLPYIPAGLELTELLLPLPPNCHDP